MDLDGIPKLAWRERLMIAYRKATGNQRIPCGETFFTLGGPATSQDSELNHLVSRGFLTSRQYVSVERDINTHSSNRKIKGPTWLYGQFDRCLARWLAENWTIKGGSTSIAFVNADIMSGIERAMPTINSVMSSIYQHNECPSGHGKVVMAFNVLESNRWAKNRGYTFQPVWDTMKNNPTFSTWLKKGVTLIDRHTYENKTVGTGCGISQLTTLIFTM
jgi:hypothetical protein